MIIQQGVKEDKVFKSGPIKICGRQSLKVLKGYGQLSFTNFTWSTLEYFVPIFLRDYLLLLRSKIEFYNPSCESIGDAYLAFQQQSS